MILSPSGQPAALEMLRSHGLVLGANPNTLRNQWYEASRWSSTRSFVWYPVQGARQDLDRFTRYELSKHGRYLYKNSPLIRGLVERITTLMAGAGFYPVFKSSDKKWNARAKAWRQKRMRNPHLGPRCSMSQYQRCVARARLVDGECFTVKTFDDLVDMEDKIQGVESNIVCGSGGENAINGSVRFFDGLKVNRNGTVTDYRFSTDDKMRPAEAVVHHFTPKRLMQFRGETILAAAINTARDVDDILSLEKQAVKSASSHKDIIKTVTGEIDPETLRSLRYGGDPAVLMPTPFNLPDDPKAKNDYYNMKFGSEPIILKTGDEYTPYIPDRPGNAWQGFMAFLANTICISAETPPSIVLPINVGGTDIRRDLEIMQRVLDPWQLDLCAEFDEIERYFIDGEINDGELKGAPDDWYLKWHMPPKINVDRAQAQQDREDYKAGLLSGDEYHGRYGDDGDEYEMEVVEEAKRRRDRIIDAGFKNDDGTADVKGFVQVLSLDSKMFQAKEGAATPPVGE